jgi:uncharacterized GH25 family protein
MRSWVIQQPLLVALAGVFLAAASAGAHDVWITMIPEGSGAVRVIVNYGHPDDRPAPNADKLFEFGIATGNQGWRTLLPGVKSAVQDGIPVLVTEPLALAGNASIWLLQARYDNGYWVKTPQGYRNTSKRQVPDAERSLSSMKFAKALLHTGDGASDVFQTVVGHRLELVPLRNPFALKPKDTLQVRVYFEGKPLAGAGVEIGDGVTPRKEEEIPRYKTNSDGIAEVPIDRPGLQLLVVDHSAPPTHPDLCDSDVSIATLSFMLPVSK